MYDVYNIFLGILCYPFASEDFIKKDSFIELVKCKPNKRAAKKKELKDQLVRHMRKYYQVSSYDEINLYLQRLYLGKLENADDEAAVYGCYLRRLENLAKTLISQRDGRLVFKYWETENEDEILGVFGSENKIFLFQRLNMHISMDLIYMIYIVQNRDNTCEGLRGFYSQIEIADQQLAETLRKGVAENHMHAGVTLLFQTIWNDWMVPFKQVPDGVLSQNRLEAYASWSSDEVWGHIMSASVIRFYLALYINKETRQNANLLLKTTQLGTVIKEYCQGWKDAQWKKEGISVSGYFSNVWEDMEEHLEIRNISRESMMSFIFHIPHMENGLEENIEEDVFLFHAMQFWKYWFDKESIEDVHWLGLFLQYVRIKNNMFQMCVQQKTLQGLDYFQREFYRKDSALNRLFSHNDSANKLEQSLWKWKSAMRRQFQNKDLRKVEFRISLTENESNMEREVYAFLKAYREVLKENEFLIQQRGWFPHIGLVFHFLKREDDMLPQKCMLQGMENADMLWYGSLIKQYKNELQVLLKLRGRIPGLDRFLVGIDAASLENATPIWAFTSVFEAARDSRIEKIDYRCSNRQSLRFTFHAGEDFRHILSGLRRIYEAVHFLKFHAGDRIGHGIALGTSVEQWKEQYPVVVLPRIEALDNYIWAYDILSRYSMREEFHPALMAYLEKRAYMLAGKIFVLTRKSDGPESNNCHQVSMQGIDMQTLIDAYYYVMKFSPEKQAQNCNEWNDLGFCYELKREKKDEKEEKYGKRREDIIHWDAEKIAAARHCYAFVGKMNEPIIMEVTKQDVEISILIQNIVQRKISQDGIIMEINPSSNLSISSMTSLVENQIFELNKPSGENNVMVCINTDDPMVFNTNISNELAYVYHGMLRKTGDKQLSLKWIDKIRACGMKASFIKEEFTYEGMQNLLDGILGQLNC